jgi:hypothetical protein
MYVGYEVMFAVMTNLICILLNVDGISKFVNDLNTVHMVLSVGFDRFVIVRNLYIMF